tara:strand:+ start:751 stop:1281 length:531 start_codon:yes stop_codon:yes gene_type:complete
MTILDFAALGLSLTAIALIAVYTLMTGAPPMPSGSKARRAAVDLLAGAEDIAELGAGWGGLAVAAARRWPAARVTAYERSPLPVLCLWLRQKAAGPENLRVVWGDFLQADLTRHDGLLCFLNREVMVRLGPKLSTLRRETSLVSIYFELPGQTADEIHQIDDAHRSALFHYRLTGL